MFGGGFLFAYLLTTPTTGKRYKVYCKTPRFFEELCGYALNLGPTSKEELLEWGRTFKSCLAVAENLLIAKAVAIYQNKPGLFWVNNNEVFYRLPVYCLWPINPRILDDFFETGFKTIGSLQQIPLESLQSRLGEKGVQIYSYCRGQFTSTISLNPPFFEKSFSEKNLELVLASLKNSIPYNTPYLFLSNQEKNTELKQDKIGLSSLKNALHDLWPWDVLTAIIWNEPSSKQGTLFNFNLPHTIYDLLAKESNLRLGLCISRREKIRNSNFIWGLIDRQS